MVGPINFDYFNGRTICITGNTGFKGAWLSFWLNQTGANLRGFSSENFTNDQLFRFAELDTICPTTYGCVTDYEKLKSWIIGNEPQLVFHFAAESIVSRAQSDPRNSFDTNLMGTVNLLEAVRQADFNCDVIIATTDKVYKNDETGKAFKESDVLGGTEPYSVSKVCTEFAAQAYQNLILQELTTLPYRKRVVSVRAGNVIGGGDWSQNRIVPHCIEACLGDVPLVLRNPDAIRPWQHVLDAIHGYLLLARHLEDQNFYIEALNFGPYSSDFLSVEEFAKQFIKCWGTENTEIAVKNSKLVESKILKLDSRLSRELLGWAPNFSVSMAIEKIVRWHKGYQHGSSARDLMLADLTDFFIEIT